MDVLICNCYIFRKAKEYGDACNKNMDDNTHNPPVIWSNLAMKDNLLI